MDMLFRLLGWDYDTQGAKADVFSQRVEALGVSFNLEYTHQGKVVVDNTVRRKGDLDNMVSEVLDRGSLDHKASLELRGKLAFAQVLGHSGKFALKLLSIQAYAAPFRPTVSEDLKSL